MSDTSLLFNFLRGRDTASPHMKRVADNANGMSSAIRLSSVLSVAATTAMVAGFAALGAQAVALVAALGPLLGLLAYLPALGAAAVGGLAPLIIAFSGIGAALKKSASGGGGSADAIVQAEHRLAQAQKASVQAQIDLNAARETALHKLRDIAAELNRSRLDEAEAALSVADAQRELAAARRSGDPVAIQHAQLALASAQQSQVEVTNRASDTQEEYNRRQKQGVEGSDEVKTALQRQADAQWNLVEAQKALAKAQSGGGGVDKAAEAYAKLSRAGQQLVDVLRSLGPQWHTVQKSIQQSVFAGVAGDLARVAAVYLPLLQTRLSQVGQGWNNAFRGTAQLVASRGFVTDMNAILGNVAVLWQRVGSSFAPFTDAFRQFAAVGSTFLPSLGSWVLQIGQRFDRWATAARTTGRAHDWIQNALTVLGQTWAVIKNLGSAIIGVFRAGSGGPNWMPGLVAGTAALAAWVNSPAGQGKLAAVFTTLRDIGSKMWAVLVHIGPTLLDLFDNTGPLVDTFNVFGVVVGFAADHLDDLAKALPWILAGFVAYKALQSAAVVVDTIRIPLIIAQTVSNFALARALNATRTAATEAAVAQTELDVAMDANPIGLVVLAIVALIAIVIVAIKYHKQIGHFFVFVWNHIWSFLKMVGAWFAGPFKDFFVNAFHWIVQANKNAWNWIAAKVNWWLDLMRSMPGRVANAARGLFDGLVHSFKAAINWMIRLWNDFHLTLGGGSVLGIDIPSVTLNTPDIPYLAQGGIVKPTPGGRLVVAGDGDEEEAVIPLSKLRQYAPQGPTTVRLVLDLRGGDADMRKMVRKWFREAGSVQAATGRA